jgi:hypothetical protein
MGVKEVFTESTVAKYARTIRAAPREVISSPSLLLSAALYAMSGIPISKSSSLGPKSPYLPTSSYACYKREESKLTHLFHSH